MSGAGGQRVEGAFISGHNIQIGSVSGDVTLVLDRPRYRLELLGPAAPPRIPRSQRLPSHLLDAQREVVPYRARPGDQQELVRWRDDGDEPVSVLLLHGAGGRGKTRLAGWLATGSHVAGWLVARGADKSGPVRPAAATVPAAGGRQPLLVMLDYAERWPLPVLVQLVDNVVFDYPDRPVRVLLLARPQVGFWDDLRAELARSGADLADPVPLGRFTVTASEGQQAFWEAAAAFQAAMELDHGPVAVPGWLTQADYGSPLTVHMAALAAVCAGHDNIPVPGRDELSAFLLEHERRYWRSAEPGTGVLERVVFVASLFGPVLSSSEARSWLRRAHLADGDAAADRLLAAHDRLYPARAEPSAGQVGRTSGVLPALTPDRFAEDFIAGYLRQPQAAELLGELLADPETRPSATRQCLIVVAAAARHPAARSVLFDLLDARPQLAIHATPPVLRMVIDHASPALAAAVQGALPRYSTELLRPARDLAQHLFDTLPPNAPAAQRASQLTCLDIRMAEVGDKRAALDPAREAVEIQRRLADADPAAHLPDLAMSLNNLGVRLSKVGDHRAALDPAREAVQIQRRLADADPAAHLPNLASALNNLGNQQSEVGDHRAALDPAREAVQIQRRLADAEPAAHLPNLASALNNLGVRLSEVGDYRAGLDPTREAVEIRRRLADAEAAAYLPDLALSLWAYAWVRAAGSLELSLALDAAVSAVEIYQQLARQLPAAFEQNSTQQSAPVPNFSSRWAIPRTQPPMMTDSLLPGAARGWEQNGSSEAPPDAVRHGEASSDALVQRRRRPAADLLT